MTAPAPATVTDQTLKARHRAMWALGDYPALALDLISELGQVLVGACGVQPGQKVLDIAAGPGNAAIPAAQAGADVVASDLTPELLEAGKLRSAQAGLDMVWQEADAEALPFGDAEFHTVMSCLGIMFAPHHAASAREMIRVCRPGGVIGLVNWTPEGFIGQMFATMKPYVPPLPPDAQPAPLWGSEDHVRALLDGKVADVRTERRTITISIFTSPAHFRDYFKARYGPTIAAYRGIADDPDRTAALDCDLADLARRHDRGVATTVMDWEYLLVTARKLD